MRIAIWLRPSSPRAHTPPHTHTGAHTYTHTYTATSCHCTACVALRISNANAAAYLHVLTCTLPANVQHFHNQRWPVPGGSASKYDNSARWTQEESCMWERDRGWTQTLPTSLHLSIHPSCLCWFDSPLCHFLPLSLMVLRLPVVPSYI